VKITVLYQSYNQAEFIEESLNAILNQTYKPFEVIMIDDCSSDNSVQILNKFIDSSKNIKLIANKKNKGTASHANIGIDEAKGDIIFFAAADDVILPNLFEEAVKNFKKYKDIGLFSAKIMSIDKNGNNLRNPKNPLSFIKEGTYLSPNICRKLLTNGGHWFTGQTCLWRVDYLRFHKLRFYEDLKYLLDHYLTINIASKYGAYFSNKYLGKWRYISTSYAHTNFKFNNAIPAYSSFKEKLLSNFIVKETFPPHKFLHYYYISIYENYLIDFISNIKLASRENFFDKIFFILLFVFLTIFIMPFLLILKLRRKYLFYKSRLIVSLRDTDS